MANDKNDCNTVLDQECYIRSLQENLDDGMDTEDAEDLALIE